jgi:hypothetical protein
MMRNAFLVVVVGASVVAGHAGVALAAKDETIDAQSLYTGQSGSIELPEHGLRISHVEGEVAVEATAPQDGPGFYVIQEMDSSGKISFVSFGALHPVHGVEEVSGTLMLLPDGSLQVEYDALGASMDLMSGAVTKFDFPGTAVLVRSSCDCSNGTNSFCATNNCNREDPCPQETQDPKPVCKWKNFEVIVRNS